MMELAHSAEGRKPPMGCNGRESRLMARPRGGQRAKRAHGRERKEPRGYDETRHHLAAVHTRTLEPFARLRS